MGIINNVKGVIKNFLDVSYKGVPTPKQGDKKARVSAVVRDKIRNLYKPSFSAAMQIEFLLTAIAEAKRPPYFSLYKLYQIYELIAEDGDVFAEWETRKLKTLAEEFALVDSKGNENEGLAELLKASWFTEFVSNALDATMYGHSLMEMNEFDKEGYATGITLIERAFVNPRLKIILNSASNFVNGYSYQDNEHLIEVGGNDLGLLRIVGKHAIWKQYSYTDWSRLSEKYGIPLLLLFLATSDDKEVESIMSEMQAIGSNGVASLDVEDKAEFLQMSNTDPYKIFQESHNMHSNIISKIITGQSDATNSNASGSFARAETHLSILNDRVRADMRRITYLVNDSLFPMLIAKSPKYKGLANHKFVYKSIEDEKLLRSHTLQSTLNPPTTNNRSGEPQQPPSTNKQSFDFFA